MQIASKYDDEDINGDHDDRDVEDDDEDEDEYGDEDEDGDEDDDVSNITLPYFTFDITQNWFLLVTFVL